MSKLVKYNPQTDLIESSWNMLSENSKAGYKSDLAMFYGFVGKNIPDVTASDIIAYVQHLREQKYKNSTINRKLASVSKTFNIHHIAGLIKTNPVELARQSGKLSFKTMRSNRSVLTLQNVKDCINAKDISQADKFAKIMIKFLAKTGLRISEMLNIELRDIEDINQKTVKIRILGKGKKERFITIEKKFIVEIKNIFKHDTLLFCTVHNNKFNRRYVWELVYDRFYRTIKIHVHPHMLRHFYATYKIVVEKKDLKAVSLYLGHQDISVTASFYLESQLDENASRIDL